MFKKIDLDNLDKGGVMKRNAKIIIGASAAVLLIVSFQNCSKKESFTQSSSNAAYVDIAADMNTGSNANDAGDGAKVAGVGSFSVPTADAVVMRIENGLQGNVRPAAGNFARSLIQLRTNLPKVTDPTRATGYDQIQLLTYGACSDLTTGGANSLMLTRYNVNPASTITVNQAALVAAGMRMLDQHTALIASDSVATAPITAAFNKLVTDISSAAGNTSIIAFMGVCIAANTAGSTLLGF